MQRVRSVSWFTVLCALCTLQCAELKPFGDYCGNHAVDPVDEDCDGLSFAVDASVGRGTPQCGPAGSGAGACHFLCGTGPSDPKCPTEDWACRQGVCVALEANGLEPLEKSTAVAGPGAAAHVADFDGDKVDEIVTIPVNPGAPLVVHFSPLDATQSKAVTLFPAPESRVVTALRGQPARLVTALEDGLRLAVVRASVGLDGRHARELDTEPFAVAEVTGAGVDILFRPKKPEKSVLVWVHGANGADDSLQVLSLLRGKRETLLTMPAVDMHGSALTEHRVVLGIPPDSRATCGRLAIFTVDSLDATTGTLDIVTPALRGSTCDWSTALKRTFTGVYPKARGPNAVFVADLKSDGVPDLIVNSREDPRVLHDMEGAFKFLLSVRPASFNGAAAPLAAFLPTGRPYPILLACLAAGAGDTLCGSSKYASVPLMLRSPNDDATGYPSVTPLSRSGVPLSAGFADLNGDGQQDVWAWFEDDTGPRVFESTPYGFFPDRLVDHGSSSLRGFVAAGPLNSGRPDDLLAVVTEGEATTTGADATVTSTVFFTSGRLEMAALTAQRVARLKGRSSPTFVADPDGSAPGSVVLTTCVSEHCNEGRRARKSATFSIVHVQPISSDWLAAAVNLTCVTKPSVLLNPGDEGLGADFTPDVYKTALRLGALQNATTTDEAQVVAVQNPGPYRPGQQRQGRARWARLKEGAALPTGCADHESTIDIATKKSSHWIAVAPAATGDATTWITLALGVSEKTPANGDVADAGTDDDAGAPADAADATGHAFLLTAGDAAVPMSIKRPEPSNDQSIWALPVDLDNDGDTDFVVLERHGGMTGGDNGTDRLRQQSDRRVRFYLNVACNEPAGRCLIVKNLDGFGDENGNVSGDALAWAQSPLEADHDASDAGTKGGGTPKVWWLGAVVGETGKGNGVVKTARIRVEGADGNFGASLVPNSASTAALPTAAVSYQHVAWGDFDGDTALDLLYVSDRGSRIFRRAEKTKGAN